MAPQATDAEFYVLHLDTDRDRTAEAARSLQENLEFATNIGARIVHLTGSNVALATAAFATENRITQAIFGENAAQSGSFSFEGTTITYAQVGGNINVSINDGQTVTNVSVPAGP